MSRISFAAAVVVGVSSFGQTVPEKARSASIAATIKEIEAECEKNGGGDWNTWYNSQIPFRTQLYKLMKQSIRIPWENKSHPGVFAPLMRFADDPNQYVHTNTVIPAATLVDDAVEWAVETPMLNVAVSMKGWLAKRGIDLIFVPAPSKADIYVDKLVPDANLSPADWNVLPHIRRRQLEFLRQGIEMVDLYPSIMKARAESKEPLYMAADKHWMQKPQRIAAAELGARLRRYPWVQAAVAAKPRYADEMQKDRPTVAMYWDFLQPAEREALWPYRLETIKKITAVGGGPAAVSSADSPILLTGDSFVSYDYPLDCGLTGLLAREVNMPITMRTVAGGLEDVFKDMFRDPSILKGKKVVIWLLNSEPLGRQDMWQPSFALPPERPGV